MERVKCMGSTVATTLFVAVAPPVAVAVAIPPVAIIIAVAPALTVATALLALALLPARLGRGPLRLALPLPLLRTLCA